MKGYAPGIVSHNARNVGADVIAKSMEGAGKYTSEFSIYSDMIYQMLSRYRYTAKQISGIVGCPVSAVKMVALKRKAQIEKNHLEYLECKRIMDENITKTQEEGVIEDVHVFQGMMRLAAMWGGRMRGKNCMRGYGD